MSGQIERFETPEQYLEYLAERYDRDIDSVRQEYRDSGYNHG